VPFAVAPTALSAAPERSTRNLRGVADTDDTTGLVVSAGFA
jgi:hypothetical protein